MFKSVKAFYQYSKVGVIKLRADSTRNELIEKACLIFNKQPEDIKKITFYPKSDRQEQQDLKTINIKDVNFIVFE